MYPLPLNPVRGTGSTGRQQIEGQLLLPLLPAPVVGPNCTSVTYIRGLGPALDHCLVGSSVSGGPQESRSVDSYGLPVESLSSSGHSIFSSTLPRTPQVTSNV